MIKPKKNKGELNKIRKQKPWGKEAIHTKKALFNKTKGL
jgi:hypothetical protein